MTTVLMCDGTWSKPGARSPVAESLRRALSPRLRFEYVDMPSVFGPATGVGDVSYAESVMQGVHDLADAVRAVDGPVIAASYSQGAAVALQFARLARKGTLAAVASLGDPHQSRHSGRAGIAGAIEDGEITCPRLSAYAPGDPIADLPLGSPLRSLADLGAWMSIRDLDAVHRWGGEMLATALEQKAQAWWQPWRWRDIESAIRYADNYLRGTNHTTDYISGGHVKRLARMIEGVAR